MQFLLVELSEIFPLKTLLIVNSHPKEIYRTSPEGLLSNYGDVVKVQTHNKLCVM